MISGNYKKNGYLISEKILNENQISSLRDDLDKEFEKHTDVMKYLHNFENKELIKKILSLYSHSTLKNIKNDLTIISKSKISILPHFNVMKNYHVDLRQFHGWHRDCSGELKYDYCNKIIGSEKYLFSKVAFYLQENSEYGGSIDIIKTSHKNFSKFKVILRKIKNIPLRIIFFLHKNFRKLYNLFPESLFMFLINAKRLYPTKGTAVLFDSRIIHRGSPISKKKLSEISFTKGDYQASTPENETKYSIYCHIGTADALDSYFFDRLKRPDCSNELKIWLDQINFISKFDTKLSEEMYSLIKPIRQKYSEHA